MKDCGCGKTVAAMKYVYTSPTGEKITYTSEVQAQAAVVRNHGGRYATIPK